MSGLFPKESHEWIKWIQDGKAIRIDQKKKVLDLIDSLRTNPAESERIGLNLSSAAKIVEDFENPVIKGENVSDEEENNELFRISGESAGNDTTDLAQRMDAVRALAEKLHLDNVEIVTEPITVTDKHGRKHRPKGYYNPKTGRITIVIGNNADVDDAVRTLLHEAVAHYGLRQLLGENFNTFLDNVYENAGEEIRGRIDALAKEKYKGNTRTATEEYLASLAEKENFEEAGKKGIWDKIKELFNAILRKAGILARKLTDNDLRYMLWRSYENLKEGGKERTMIEAAEELLRSDLARVSRGVLSLGVCRTAYELDALTDFAFNLGLGALKGSTLLKVIRAGDSPAHIEKEFKRWVYAGGQIQEGLVKRRAWEARRYFGEV